MQFIYDMYNAACTRNVLNFISYRLATYNAVVQCTLYKKVTHSGSKAPIYGELYRDFPQRLSTWPFPQMHKYYSSWEVSIKSQSQTGGEIPKTLYFSVMRGNEHQPTPILVY